MKKALIFVVVSIATSLFSCKKEYSDPRNSFKIILNSSVTAKRIDALGRTIEALYVIELSITYSGPVGSAVYLPKKIFRQGGVPEEGGVSFVFEEKQTSYTAAILDGIALYSIESNASENPSGSAWKLMSDDSVNFEIKVSWVPPAPGEYRTAVKAFKFFEDPFLKNGIDVVPGPKEFRTQYIKIVK